MLRLLWALSLLLGVISLAIMTLLIMRRVIAQRRVKADALQQRNLLKSLITFSQDRDRSALKQAVLAVPAQVALKASFEFLSLLRGEEHDEVVATLLDCGLAKEVERQVAKGNGAQRIHATEMLAALRSENAVSVLLRTLDGDRSREVRIAAAIALCDLDALPSLEIALRKIGVAGQRSRRLIDLFRRLPADRAEELKEFVKRTDPTPFVRAAVIDALARSGDFRLAGFFGEIAESAPAEVAAAAIRALGRTGHPTALAILTRATSSDDWEVRHAAAEAAGHLGLPGLAATLARLLDDEVWTVRYAAAKALRATGPEGERVLTEIATNQVSRSQRTASLILSEGPVA